MLTPQVLRQLTKELQDLHTDEELVKELGIRVAINEQDVTDIAVEIDGPSSTPYEGGLFRMKLSLPTDYPNSPPKGFFTNKIWHPNVSKSGEICVNVLKRDWKPDMGIKHVLLVIRCLLIEPYPESALNEEAGKALLEDYSEYARYAKLMTSLHAQHPKRHMPLTASGANAGSSSIEGCATPDGSPAIKKPKADRAAAVSKVKKNLKRL